MPLRQYDAAIGRFNSIDPVTHHEFSPYVAFDNNPVFWADPSGADAIEHSGGTLYTGIDAKNIFKEIQSQYGGNNSSEENNEGGVLNDDGTCCADSGTKNSYETKSTVKENQYYKSLSEEERAKYDENGRTFRSIFLTSLIPVGGIAKVVFRGGKWIVTIAQGSKVVSATVSSSKFIKLLKPISEFDEAVTLFRGTTGSEAGSASLFLTDNAAVAATYVKNGGQVVSYRVSQYSLKFLESSGALNLFKGIHKTTGIVNNEFQFVGKELVKALNMLANPLK